MRTRVALGLGGITGLLVIAVSWDFPAGGVTWLGVSALGLLLGAASAACVMAADRWPRRTTALLVALAPALGVIAATTGITHLNEVPALLALPLLLTLLRRAKARLAVRLNPLTAAVSAYALAAIPSALLSGSFVAALTRLLPLSLFFTGMLLQSGRPHESPGEERATLLRLLAPALLCGAIWLAVLALRFPPSAEAARSTALLLGTLALLAISWDSRRFFWRVVLGHPQRSVRVGAALVGLAYLVTSGVALMRLATPGIVIALAFALMVVAVARRRFSEIALACVSFLPLMSGFGVDWLRAPLLSLSAGFDGRAWGNALTLAVSTPFGVGFQRAQGFGLYQRTLAATGVSGLVALALTLLLTIIMCTQAYARLRPSSGEAGGMLAAGGLCLFVALAGFFSDPLASPALAMVLWLFLGMANGTIEAVRRVTATTLSAEEQARFARLRGYPLRIAYVLPGDASGEAALAFADYLHILDRARIRPVLLAVGTGALASLARGMGVEVRVVKSSVRLRKAALSEEESHMWRGRLDHRRQALRRSALMVRAALALEPDLLVSLDPALHLATLSAGRLAGVPVQWHSHEVASRGIQRALDTLAPWTVGILASSQAIARTYNVRMVGAYIKVLRPSVLIDGPQRATRSAVRQRLGLPEDAHLLAVIGPIAADSGHQDVLDALLLLRETAPNPRMVLLEEAPPQAALGDDRPTTRQRANAAETGGEVSRPVARLRDSIAAHGLEDAVTVLGPRADALELLAASDVVIFPQECAMGSRDLLLALASGTPLVATRTGSHDELLRDAWGYLLVPPHDPQGLATAITGVLQQHDLYRANARRNPALVRDWFSPQIEAARLARIYRDLCQPEGQTLRLPARHEVAPLPRHWVTALWEPRTAE